MSDTNLVPWSLRIVQIGSEGIAIKPDSGDLRIDAKTLAMCSSCALALLFAAAPDMLAALKKIAADYGGCHCNHTDENCCAKIGEFCPHCISEIAIAKVGTQ